MKKQVVTKKKVINDLRRLFSITAESTAARTVIEHDGKFMINKSRFGRLTIIAMLQGYFQDNMFEVGYGLEVDPVTFVFTTFKIIKIEQEQVEKPTEKKQNV